MARKEYIQKAFTFNGKRYYAYGKTEAEAIRNRELKRIALEQGKVLTEATMTLAEWSAQCIETYKVNCSEKNKERFYLYCKRKYPAFNWSISVKSN